MNDQFSIYEELSHHMSNSPDREGQDFKDYVIAWEEWLGELYRLLNKAYTFEILTADEESEQAS